MFCGGINPTNIHAVLADLTAHVLDMNGQARQASYLTTSELVMLKGSLKASHAPLGFLTETTAA